MFRRYDVEAGNNDRGEGNNSGFNTFKRKNLILTY